MDSPLCSDGSTPGILGMLPIALDIAFLPNHYACPEETPAELFVHLQQNLSLLTLVRWRLYYCFGFGVCVAAAAAS